MQANLDPTLPLAAQRTAATNADLATTEAATDGTTTLARLIATAEQQRRQAAQAAAQAKARALQARSAHD